MTAAGPRLAEAVAVAVGGAVLGGAAGAPFGLARPCAVVAGLNGAISGWRQVYEWPTLRGTVAFTLDSTWAIANTAGALASHAVAVGRGGAGYDASLSRRQNRHVYSRGFQPRRTFLITVGNVVSGAGDTTAPRRRKLVTDHEDVHVWQARWFGPLYPVLYAGWMAAGGAAGAVLWALRRRHQRFSQVVETCAYYLNPFEWWAYSRDGHWPPGKKVPDLGWKRPIVPPRPTGN
jgi:hypothetical protein